MPTAMHFFNRQYWHRFLLILRMEHCWFLVQGRYWIFCCMERRKKPWEAQVQLESRSPSEPSSLEQPESVESERASSMLTSTECRERSSAHDILTIHNTAHSPLTLPLSEVSLRGMERTLHWRGWRPTADCAGGGERGAQLPARPTCRPPTQPRKWEYPRPPRGPRARR